MFVEGVYVEPIEHTSDYQSLEATHNEVIKSDDKTISESSKEWSRLTPNSSPQSSSGYQSSQTSGDEAIDGNTEDKDITNTQKKTETKAEYKMETSDWDYEEFDPKNPYLYEPLTYPPEQELHVPPELSKLFYLPCRALPKRIQRKRINLSPEIKPKISKKTGRPKRSSQFLSADSPSENSDSD